MVTYIEEDININLFINNFNFPLDHNNKNKIDLTLNLIRMGITELNIVELINGTGSSLIFTNSRIISVVGNNFIRIYFVLIIYVRIKLNDFQYSCSEI